MSQQDPAFSTDIVRNLARFVKDFKDKIRNTVAVGLTAILKEARTRSQQAVMCLITGF
jgi:hypothetical protein